MSRTFGGATFNRARDEDRLFQQLWDVYELMKDRRWRTLPDIAKATGHPEPSVSARLRDFRKEKFGGHTVERAYIGDGLWQYRLLRRMSQAA